MKQRRWELLKKRIKAEANDVLQNNVNDGTAIITVHMLVQHDGEPILWVVQDKRRIEPSADAKRILASLLDGLS